FGMLLWELAFEKILYKDLDMNKIMEIVINGNCEKITFGQATLEHQKVQRGLKKIIIAGNSAAKFWKARYLADAIFVKKDIVQAAKLFKEAAEDNNIDACFCYALLMTDKSLDVEFNCEKFIVYLTKAADASNAMAQYNLGNMHLKGNLSSYSNADLGIKYLKLAALNSHPTAEEVLKAKNIEINE
ncbi:8022_t:CDS:2, partial [Gigaspora margarita]